MPRPCQRATLEYGLKLNINRLIRGGLVRPGARTGPIAICWQNTDGEQIAVITANMCGLAEGWFHIKSLKEGGFNQRICLQALPRHFGGRQWFFRCPRLDRRATVLWKPPGAHSFACRQRWDGQAAYHSQFLTRNDRAHRGQAKIKARLCQIGGFDADNLDFPPKPKWMRWDTYNRAIEQFNRYEEILDEHTFALVARLTRRV